MKIVNHVSIFGRKRIEFVGIKNKCCTNGNMEKYDDKYFRCRTCSRLFTIKKELKKIMPQPIPVIAMSFLISIICSALIAAFIVVPFAEKDHTQYRSLSLILAYTMPISGPLIYLYSQYLSYKKFIKNNSEDQNNE